MLSAAGLLLGACLGNLFAEASAPPEAPREPFALAISTENGGRSASRLPAIRPAGSKLDLPLLRDRAVADYSHLAALFDQGGGRASAPAVGAAPRLRALGLELGAGDDPIQRDNEPFLRKGLEPLPFDMRARVSAEGLGARAKVLHPTGLRSLSVGALGYFDLLKAAGVGPVRDKAYSAFGQTPEVARGGFEAGVSGALNERLGGATTYDARRARKGARFLDKKVLTVGAGYSPLGDNPGKRWNYALLAGASHSEVVITEPGRRFEGRGFGYSAGAAFQRAFSQSPAPWTQSLAASRKAFVADRLKTTLEVARSRVSSLAATAGAEFTFVLFRKLELRTGMDAQWTPDPNPANPEEKSMRMNGRFGVNWRY